MNRDTFVFKVKELMRFQDLAFKLEDILGGCIGTESFISEIIDGYGDLILEMVLGDREALDASYEKFWNIIINPGTTDEEIGELYDELINIAEEEVAADE